MKTKPNRPRCSDFESWLRSMPVGEVKVALSVRPAMGLEFWAQLAVVHRSRELLMDGTGRIDDTFDLLLAKERVIDALWEALSLLKNETEEMV